jgi:dihydroorotase
MKYIIKNAEIVTDQKKFHADLMIENDLITRIDPSFSINGNYTEINGEGMILMPGVIDDQVHFREPGLTHKADIYTESRAAVAGGTTSFMEMPNTSPATYTNTLLEEKYVIGAKSSLANYSFYLGASNDNIDEIKKVDTQNVCGIKIFMGSSTGNLLVDNEETLEAIFKEAPMLIATHCEDEATVRDNFEKYKAQFGDDIPFEYHPIIRDEKACYLSSSKAVALAQKNNTRLHILHISTAEEIALFSNKLPLAEKRVTAEACVHHLWYDSSDYQKYGSLIKCNPAIKDRHHKEAILKALLDDTIDIIATDHAPHTWDEKQGKYASAPSGVPLVQHSLQMMMEFYLDGKMTIEQLVNKMCHTPAICFQVKDRGYVREGFKADLALVNPYKSHKVTKENILYKCGWSPFENQSFRSSIHSTFVSGRLAFQDGKIIEGGVGERLSFDRKF